jgi:hypothetical protein
MKNRNRWVCWATVVLLAGCGGATSDDLGSTTGTGGAGGSAAGSSGAGGQAAGGSGQGGAAGSGATAGSGQSGKGQTGGGQAGKGQAGGGQAGTAGQGQAGSGQSGNGQAGQGQAGSGTAGQGQAGQGQGGAPGCCTMDMECGDLVPAECVNGVCVTPLLGQCWRDADCDGGKVCQGASVCPCGAACDEPDSPGKCVAQGAGWSSCGGPGDCQLQFNSCCGTCGVPKAGDFDAVAFDKTQAHFTDVCPSPTPCPACASQDNNNLAAFCEANTCQVVEISTDPISACAVDADCTVRLAKCCDCGAGQPADYIALRSQDYYTYETQVCGPGGGGCALDCAPSSPPVQAVCNQTTKHCQAVAKPAALVCPATAPQANSPCANEGAACEYGDDPRPDCRPQASCMQGVWSVLQPKCPALPGPGESGCPSDLTANGASCATEGLFCNMGAGASCLCSSCLGGPCSNKAQWGCVAAPAAPCPTVAPDAGQPCAPEGTECAYGVGCSKGSALRKCQQGVWVQESVVCPL